MLYIYALYSCESIWAGLHWDKYLTKPKGWRMLLEPHLLGFKPYLLTGHGGAHMKPQHLGGVCRTIKSWSHPQLHSKWEASLVYMKPAFNQINPVSSTEGPQTLALLRPSHLSPSCIHCDSTFSRALRGRQRAKRVSMWAVSTLWLLQPSQVQFLYLLAWGGEVLRMKSLGL